MKKLTILIMGLFLITIVFSAGSIITPTNKEEPIDKETLGTLKDITGQANPELVVNVYCDASGLDCYYTAYMPNIIDTRNSPNYISGFNRSIQATKDDAYEQANTKVLDYADKIEDKSYSLSSSETGTYVEKK